MTDPRTWSWDADDLRDALLGERHDLVFLAGHFSANSALAADYQTQVVDDRARRLVGRPGEQHRHQCRLPLRATTSSTATPSPASRCRSTGRRRSRRSGAVLVAGTGYQYGDTDFLEYSERLYRDFAEELRAGAAGTPISIGEALAAAKRTYIDRRRRTSAASTRRPSSRPRSSACRCSASTPRRGRTGTPPAGGTRQPDRRSTDGPAATLGPRDARPVGRDADDAPKARRSTSSGRRA